MGNAAAKDPDYWNVPDDPGVRNLNWMARLPSSTSIAQLSVPGTHDSMACDGNIWVYTQSLSLIIQLMVGVRFFDIRCRHFNDGLPIHHGAFYQNANFDDVLRTTINFLNIVIHLKPFLCASRKSTMRQETQEVSVNRCRSPWTSTPVGFGLQTLFRRWDNAAEK